MLLKSLLASYRNRPSFRLSAGSSSVMTVLSLCVFFLLTSCGSGSSSSSIAVQNEDVSVKLAFNLSAVSVASSDLVAHYDFDQAIGSTIYDISGNGYDGVAQAWDDESQQGSVWTEGQHGNALLFSERGRVTIDDDANLDAALGQNGISISLWFRLTHTSTDGYVRLVSKKPEWTQAEGFELEYNPVARQIHLVCQGANFIEGIVPVASVDTEWHHVIASLDGTNGTIRFDDQDITNVSTVPLAGILENPHPLTIGALANGSAAAVAPFQGAIDDLRIYSRALTLSEQQQLFIDTQKDIVTDEMVAWWTADDSGTTIVDSSGFGHDGLATNMTAEAGFVNGAITGADVDARVNVGGETSLALQGAMSISAWVRVTDDEEPHYMRIVSKKFEDADAGGYEFAYYPEGNNLIFNGEGVITAAVSVDLGIGWNHLSVTVDGQDVIFYRNGLEIGTGSINGLVQSDTPVYLGHRAREDAGLPGVWLGSLDDIRMYNYALDANAVASIYGETLRAPENPASTYAGLLYEYYEGAWSALPDFDSETVVATSAIANFDITPRLQDSDFGFRFSGYVEILEHGEYTFNTSSDDGSQLFIGNTLIVDNDGLHSNQKRSGSIRLQAGLHAITGTFFERGGNEIFDVTWSGPSFTETAIPDARLHRDTGINFPPIINLTIAGDITASIETESVVATVVANDPEDGAFDPADIAWTSSIDGVLGTGFSFDIAALTVGEHVITVSVSDDDSQAATDTLVMSIQALSSFRDADTPGPTTAGINYAYYEGSWSVLPTFAALSPLDAGILSIPDLTPRAVDDYYAFRYHGYVLVPSNGVYTFGLNSDDGSRLKIGNTVVVDNDGLHGSILRTGSIGLKAGLHEIEVAFFERTGAAVFDVQWTGPSISTATIPASQYFRLDADEVPQVSILTPAAVSAVQPGDMVNLTGAAFDVEDASFADNQWQWTSNLDGSLGDSDAVSIDTLSEGVHTITLSVTDSDSNVGQASVIIMVSTVETGLLNRELWLGIGGVRISDLTGHANYPDSPDETDTLTSFEGPVNWANNYGTRIRGYLYAPVTGAYTFWISSDDFGEFYLSTDDTAANKVLTANVPGWTNSREWEKYSQQKSVTVNLVAGERYYIEALQKEGGGADNVAVAWEFPGLSRSVIDGSFCAPFIPVVNN